MVCAPSGDLKMKQEQTTVSQEMDKLCMQIMQLKVENLMHRRELLKK